MKILLGLIEFMVRQKHSLWIDIPVLAKAVSLITSKLNTSYALTAESLLCNNRLCIINPTWFEKLNRRKEPFRESLQSAPDHDEQSIGAMLQCLCNDLHALHDYAEAPLREG